MKDRFELEDPGPVMDKSKTKHSRDNKTESFEHIPLSKRKAMLAYLHKKQELSNMQQAENLLTLVDRGQSKAHPSSYCRCCICKCMAGY